MNNDGAAKLSTTAQAALLLIASRDGGGSKPVRVTELDEADLNALCAAGCVELAIGASVTVTLSPTGLDAVDELRLAR